eukprot:GHVU01085045.1.p1 GENE.GHVU01085045.1~~GHVU01085045.1.p1  ORF type:complete len:134 (+),score=2.03 GHVU01085045.1:220-621(+)
MPREFCGVSGDDARRRRASSKVARILTCGHFNVQDPYRRFNERILSEDDMQAQIDQLKRLSRVLAHQVRYLYRESRVAVREPTFSRRNVVSHGLVAAVQDARIRLMPPPRAGFALALYQRYPVIYLIYHDISP